MGTSALDTVIGSFTLDPNGDPKGGVISSYLMGAAWPPVVQGRHHPVEVVRVPRA